jgi:hypothetical protein
MLQSVTERFAHEIIQSFKMSWAGQRLYDGAYREAEKDHGPYGERAPWQYRMDAAGAMIQDADDVTNAIEARAIAAGVNVTDMLYLVDQHLYDPVDLAG